MKPGTAKRSGNQSEKSLFLRAKSTARDISKPHPMANKPVPSQPTCKRAAMIFVAASGSANGEKREITATKRQPTMFPIKMSNKSGNSRHELKNPAVPVYSFVRYLTTAMSPTQKRNIPKTEFAKKPHPAMAIRIPAKKDDLRLEMNELIIISK
jgi:hypothetical protein